MPCRPTPPILALLLMLALGIAQSAAAKAPPKAAIASAHPAATAAGMQVLREGGNAFDAAVAVSAALAVVEPQSSGLGGGGFWLLHVAAKDRDVMVDGREKAPQAATRHMYLNHQGQFEQRASRNGGLAAGIPGEPAALAHIAKAYGNLGLARDLAPAIRLATNGVPINREMHDLIAYRKHELAQHSASAKLLLTDDGKPRPVGALLVQTDLANTLQALAKHGADGFYHGPVAHELVHAARAAGGIWTLKDLADYQAVERQPTRGSYHTANGNYRIISASPPSSGGIVLVEALNILSGFDWNGLDNIHRKHVAVEAMRRAYRDRAQYLGDPDFGSMPVARLTSKNYAAGLRVGIRMNRATRSDALAPVTAGYTRDQGPDTTHFSIVDRQGNRVAATLSVNFPFGSGVLAPATGVFLNDEMDDFAAKPLTPNGYGLIGTEANAIAPGKRPLSSMSPTFVVGNDRTIALGTPGGSRIISMVLLGILDFTHGGDAESVVSKPRYHNQYLPDEIQYEPGALSARTRSKLKAMGHHLHNVGRHYGDMQAVIWNLADGAMDAASDPRGMGCAAVGIGDRHCGKRETRLKTAATP